MCYTVQHAIHIAEHAWLHSCAWSAPPAQIHLCDAVLSTRELQTPPSAPAAERRCLRRSASTLGLPQAARTRPASGRHRARRPGHLGTAPQAAGPAWNSAWHSRACDKARVMKAPPRPLSQKRTAEGLQGRVRRARLYVLSPAGGAARRSTHLPLRTTSPRGLWLAYPLRCVCFITAGPITKLCAWGEEESGGHVL